MTDKELLHKAFLIRNRIRKMKENITNLTLHIEDPDSNEEQQKAREELEILLEKYEKLLK